MAQPHLASFVPRPERLALLLMPALLLFPAAGCSGRRQSMRPVYMTPAPAVSSPCPSGDCGGGVAPSRGSSTTTIGEPALNESSTSGPAAEAPLSASPSSTRGTSRSVTPPPTPAFPDEPGLEPAGTESDTPSKAPPARSNTPGSIKPGATSKPSGVGPAPTLEGPSASLSPTKGTRAAPTPVRLRQASLSAQLEPFVNDPADLFTPPKADRPWKYIVLHHSANEAGSYNSIDHQHRDRLGWQGCGYHFVIGNGSESPDGQIEVSQRWSNQKLGVHCRDSKNPDVNEYGIGICLVGDLEKSPPTERQIAAAKALVAYLESRYSITRDHAETHAHLASSPISCPGRLFPAQAILGDKSLALR